MPPRDAIVGAIGFLDKKHAALEHLVEPPSLYQSVLVYQHVRMDVPADAPGGAWVLARLEDGEPLSGPTQHRPRLGHDAGHQRPGRLDESSLAPDLPPAAGPAHVRSGRRRAERSTPAWPARPLVLEFPGRQAQPLTVEVVPPSGTQNRLPTQAEPGRRGQVFRYADTHDIGFYIAPSAGRRPDHARGRLA